MVDPSVRIRLDNIGYHRGRRAILKDVCWHVAAGQHWAVVGPNGSGKTTLLQIATGYAWPSRGDVSILGQQFGQVDLRQLRRKIGWVSSSLSPLIRPSQSARQIVLSGAFASTALFDRPTPAQRRRADQLIARMGLKKVADSCFGTCSLGEQQKALIARALMPQPALLILDEPSAGLDLPSREALLESLQHFGTSQKRTSVVLVTHHIEEIPPAFSHVMVMKNGRVLAQGKKSSVLTGDVLSEAFALSVKVDCAFGRYWPRIGPRGGPAARREGTGTI